MKRLAHFISYVLLALGALLLFVPMVWMTLCAFAPKSELQTAVPLRGMFTALVPGSQGSGSLSNWARAYLTTENFADGQNGLFDITAMPVDEFLAAHPIPIPFLSSAGSAPEGAAGKGAVPKVPGGMLILWFENTILVSVAVTALSVLFNAMAGYTFAKIPFPGRELVFWVVLATIMIPGQVTLIPLFLIFTRVLPLGDSLWAVILPQVAAPVGIFLMRQYMRGLPTALEEAARIDGCSEPGIFARVILPLSKPVLAVWAVFTFIGAWKAFLWPLVITNDQYKFMIEPGLKTLQFTAGPRNPGIMMAAALLASIPMIATFFLFQKQLTKGLTVGGVKG